MKEIDINDVKDVKDVKGVKLPKLKCPANFTKKVMKKIKGGGSKINGTIPINPILFDKILKGIGRRKLGKTIKKIK